MFKKLKEEIINLILEGNYCHNKSDGRFCGGGNSLHQNMVNSFISSIKNPHPKIANIKVELSPLTKIGHVPKKTKDDKFWAAFTPTPYIYGQHHYSSNKITLFMGSIKKLSRDNKVSIETALKHILSHELGHAATRRTNAPDIFGTDEGQADKYAKKLMKKYNRFW
jgi:hypothetical protein